MRNSITLGDLQKDFETRSERSLDKSALLKREVECYEFILLFDHDSMEYHLLHLGSKTSNSFSWRFPEYSHLFNDTEIYKIKKAYDYMVQGATISKSEDEENDDFEPPVIKPIRKSLTGAESSSISKAKMCYDYLCWLKNNPVKRKYAEKYYAWHHRIKVAIGQAEHIPPGAKQLVITTGEKLYGTGYGFYQAYINFNPEKPTSFVNGLSDKEKRKWKKIILEISGNDSKVKRYLDEFPD